MEKAFEARTPQSWWSSISMTGTVLASSRNCCKSRVSATPNRGLFRLAIEEMEAWLLGDRDAIVKAFPRAKMNALHSYRQDSICGTWEMLADALFPGGASAPKAEGYPRIGEEKCRWASLIGRHLDFEANLSPSLRAFRFGLLKLSGVEV